jgi:hypothetical protein
MGQDWIEIEPMGGESSEERLKRAQEELLSQWGSTEQGRRDGINFWVTGFLLLLVFALFAWNISLRRSLSSREKVSEGQESLKVVKGEMGKVRGEMKLEEKMKGGEVSIERGMPSHSPAPLTVKPSEQKGKEEKTTAPILFPLPVYSSHQPLQKPSSQAQPSQTQPSSEGTIQPQTRPIFPSTPSLPSPSLSPENLQLVGLVITQKVKLAVIKVGTRTVTVMEGETIPLTGWEVKKIEPEGIHLVFKEKPQEKLVLRPSF